MVRARTFANVSACRAVSNPALSRIFREISHFSLSILGRCFDVLSLGKTLNPQMLHLTQVKMSTW